MKRQHIIEAHETLIPVMYMASIQRAFANQSTFFGKAMNDAAVLENVADDDIIKVLRLDTKTWSTTDITEACAKLFLDDYAERYGEIDLSDEASFPAFVKTSTAWARLKDDIEAQTPVYRDDVDTMPSFRDRVYNALSAA